VAKQRQKVHGERKPSDRTWWWIAGAFAVASILGFVITSKLAGPPEERSVYPNPTTGSTQLIQPKPDAEVFSEYAGTQSCRECHEEAFKLFENSHHALAERPINPDTDKCFFEPARSIQHGNQTSEAGMKGDGPKLKTAALDSTQKEFLLERVIGVSPLIQFLVPGERGRLQVTELAVDPRTNEWFDIFGNEDRQPGEWGHWTGRGMTWNTMCAACHNTRVRKNYDESTDSYATKMAEMTVSCEACHGPMRAHVAWQKKEPKPTGTDPTVKRLTADQTLDTCATCHSRRSEFTGDFQPGDKFFDHHALTIPDETDIYHPDGQVRDEDYEFASFLGSRMHDAGVRCINCHEPHSAKIRLPGDALCMQCHSTPTPPAPKIDPLTHTFHSPGEPGSHCVDCHMPQTTYMQRHARRDHGFTIPDPLLTKKHGIPNACNRCHQDKDADWALGFVEKWYGNRMDRFTRKRAEVVAEAREPDSDASSKLLSLLKEEKSPYWRAVEIGLLRRWAGDPAVTASLLAHVENTNDLVRTVAARSLEPLVQQNLPAVSGTLTKLLMDPVRSVRIEAAWALRKSVETNAAAGDDLLRYLRHNADQPAGVLQMGVFHFDRGENEKALSWFQRAAKWDPHSGAFRHALAVCFNALGKNTEAIRELREACRLSPTDAEFQFKLGLALNEAGQLQEAVKALEQTVKLDPQYAQAWYNLGLGYSAMEQPQLAIETLLKAESVNPAQPLYPYARATVLARIGNNNEARLAAQRALEIQPSFSEAAELLRALNR
jgi:predicted CXXCH cytochrome family protein